MIETGWEAVMMRGIVEDLVELACLAVFLSGMAALASPGLGAWIG